MIRYHVRWHFHTIDNYKNQLNLLSYINSTKYRALQIKCHRVLLASYLSYYIDILFESVIETLIINVIHSTQQNFQVNVQFESLLYTLL